MASVFSILNQLSATSSRLEKEAILQKNCSDLLLKDAFRLALDPTLNFYIKKVPEPIVSSMSSSLEDVLKMLETDMATRRVRGGEAQRRVASGPSRRMTRRLSGGSSAGTSSAAALTRRSRRSGRI